MSTTVFLGFPGHGHANPFLPIAQELVRRGERVICYLTPEFQAAVERTGAVFRRYRADFPLLDPHTAARHQQSPAGTVRVQLETSKWALEHLLPEIQQARPDYLMHDSLAAWGWYLAQVLAQTSPLPSVSLFPTLLYKQHAGNSRRAESVAQQARHWLGRIYNARTWASARALSARYHLPPLDHPYQLLQNHGDLNLVCTSRAFQPEADSFDPSRYKFIGPSITPRPDTPDFPFDRLDGRPLILIALGTAFDPGLAFYDSCLNAFADTPYQMVMGVAGGESRLASLVTPPNFIIRSFVPQLELLARASVFVSHGGMNSVNEALYHNVPLVMVPQGADHAWIAARVAQLGAGIRLDKHKVNAEILAGAVRKLLDNPAYAQSASRIGASLRSTGGALQAADEIASFKRAHAISVS